MHIGLNQSRFKPKSLFSRKKLHLLWITGSKVENFLQKDCLLISESSLKNHTNALGLFLTKQKICRWSPPAGAPLATELISINCIQENHLDFLQKKNQTLLFMDDPSKKIQKCQLIPQKTLNYFAKIPRIPFFLVPRVHGISFLLQKISFFNPSGISRKSDFF